MNNGTDIENWSLPSLLMYCLLLALFLIAVIGFAIEWWRTSGPGASSRNTFTRKLNQTAVVWVIVFALFLFIAIVGSN